MPLLRSACAAIVVLAFVAAGAALAQTPAPSSSPTSTASSKIDDISKWTSKQWKAAKAKWAKGSYIHDANGKRYIDGSSGPAVYCIGHGNEEVNAAIADRSRPDVGRSIDAKGHCSTRELRQPSDDAIVVRVGDEERRRRGAVLRRSPTALGVSGAACARRRETVGNRPRPDARKRTTDYVGDRAASARARRAQHGDDASRALSAGARASCRSLIRAFRGGFSRRSNRVRWS